jgi:hypothetical protein
MKIRDGFVSNSSSTSFTCDVSGTVLAGRDGEYDEPTSQCIKCGAEFVGRYTLQIDASNITLVQKRDILAAMNESNWGEGSLAALRIPDRSIVDVPEEEIDKIFDDVLDNIKNRWGGHLSVHEIFCPCCNLSQIVDGDMMKYLMAKSGFFTRDEVCNEMRGVFGSREALQTFIKTMTK